jgi:putative holliday junction resolvase
MSKEYNKYLAIDYGTRRIGLAAGSIFPKGLGMIENSDINSVISKISKLVMDNEIEAIIIGSPVRSLQEPGTLDKEIKDFADKLTDATKLEVFFEEEQFTSAEATRLMESEGRKIERKSGDIDELAAILILEQYLRNHQNED